MKPYLVGLAGPAGVGKNTAASLMEHPRYHYAFAGPLKAMLNAINLWEPANRAEKERLIPHLGFSWRQAAQTLGTEWGRALHPELWLQLAKMEWEKRDDAFMIITDVRFENEAQWIRENGTVVHLYGRETTVDGVAKQHASEQGLFVYPEDALLDNRGDTGRLKEHCETLGEELRRRRNEKLLEHVRGKA